MTLGEQYHLAPTLGYLAGLRGEDPNPELGHLNSQYDEAWLLGATAREQGVQPKKIMGYHRDEDLPIKRGDIVIIKKGTLVRCNGETKPAGRTYRVLVRSLGCGSNLFVEGSAFRQDVRPLTNPTVMWAGAGGYWAEADINDVEVAP